MSALLGLYLLEDVEVLAVDWNTCSLGLGLTFFRLRHTRHLLYIIAIIGATQLVKIRPPYVLLNIDLLIILLHLLVEIGLLVRNDLLEFLLNYVDAANHFFYF